MGTATTAEKENPTLAQNVAHVLITALFLFTV